MIITRVKQLVQQVCKDAAPYLPPVCVRSPTDWTSRPDCSVPPLGRCSLKHHTVARSLLFTWTSHNSIAHSKKQWSCQMVKYNIVRWSSTTLQPGQVTAVHMNRSQQNDSQQEAAELSDGQVQHYNLVKSLLFTWTGHNRMTHSKKQRSYQMVKYNILIFVHSAWRPQAHHRSS